MNDQEADRLTVEAQFWDRHVDEKRLFFRRGWYRQVNQYLWDRTLALLGDLHDQRVLFVGCGESASKAKQMAQQGGEIWALDISPASIEKFQRHTFGDVREQIHTIVGDAENMPFDDNSFDVVIGKAIVHHLNIDLFLKEIRRVSAPGAQIVFCEPLATNPFIEIFRKLTPGLRVPSEHPLSPTDLKLIARQCQSLSCEHLDFTTGLSFPFFVLGLSRLGQFACTVTRAVDRAMFRVLPPTRWLAWSVVFSGHLTHLPGENNDQSPSN